MQLVADESTAHIVEEWETTTWLVKTTTTTTKKWEKSKSTFFGSVHSWAKWPSSCLPLALDSPHLLGRFSSCSLSNIVLALGPRCPVWDWLDHINKIIGLSILLLLDFKFQMMRHIIKSRDILIVLHILAHGLPKARQWTNHCLDLLLVRELVSGCIELTDHIWHHSKMLLHRMLRVHHGTWVWHPLLFHACPSFFFLELNQVLA